MILRKIFSFSTVTLLVALTLSAIAAWYSVLGLTAIFAAAVIPIVIMGGSLEVAKVVTTVWLHRYWERAGWKLKLYLVPAVVALAFLTSMGIFGFLSKAHSDQGLVSGDVTAKVAIYDEKIKTAQGNIESNRKALQQMDAQVDQLLGRTTDDKGANRAVSVRNQQKRERNRLQNEIAADQEAIAKLNEEAAPIRAEIRKVEAEVGPIKYIAALIYGDNPDSNLLERAVRWVIILIVFVFDPLALCLVIAAQHSYKWLDDDLRNKRKDDEEEAEEKFKETFLNTKIDEDTSKWLDENLDDILNDNPYDVEEGDDDTFDASQNTIEPDDVVGGNGDEAPLPVTDEDSGQVEHEEENVKGSVEREPQRAEATPVIKTEGVTIQETDGGYVQYEGKSVSKAALEGMHPELFVAKPDSQQPNTNFGTDFPRFARKGDTFVRVDILPNKVFKFSGEKWIEVNKSVSTSYVYDEEYIRYLVTKIEAGEYDVELLSDREREQIEEYLNRS